MGPRWHPKSAQKRPQNCTKNGSKNGSNFGLLLDLFWDPFWGPKRFRPGVTFFKIFVIFKTLFGSKNANSPVKTACFAPWLGALNGLVFNVFCHFQDPLRIEKCKQSCKNCLFCSPARGPKKLFFSRFSGLLFWLHVGSVLAPSWPHPGLSWPLLAHLGPSWPHLGLILASSWPSWPFLAPSWPLLGPVLALLAALGPILALLGLLGSWVLFWGSTGALFGFSWGSLGLSWASPTEVAPTTAATAAAVKAAVADSGLHYLWAIYMGMGWGGTYDHHFCHCFV